MQALLAAGRGDLVLRNFAVYLLVTTTVLIAVQWRLRACLPAARRPGRVELWILGSATLVYFAVVTVPAAPKALWVEPPLLGFTLWALNRNRLAQADAVGVASPATGFARWNCLGLYALPMVAIAVYGLALAGGLRGPHQPGGVLRVLAGGIGALGDRHGEGDAAMSEDRPRH